MTDALKAGASSPTEMRSDQDGTIPYRGETQRGLGATSWEGCRLDQGDLERLILAATRLGKSGHMAPVAAPQSIRDTRQRGAAREYNPLPPPRNALVVDVARDATRQAVRLLAESGTVVHFMPDQGALNRLVEEIWDGGGRIVAVDNDDLNHRPLLRIVQDAELRLGPIDLIVGPH